MKNGKSQIIFHKIGLILTAIAFIVAKFNINTTCTFVAYQPTIPDSAKKLRKF